ncbi:hypothetical protein LEP1GSC016_2771 [Leptospira borgpetersenii serovar Hardjo-bovis str. Sponselee]|uniref:Uncharacterized protein n=1 Tax=Leptospira borgpetersenii serovar Hardjo-bovis str. Sponselee TaxID=1303729 RepID=M6BGI7_LEPBO|nr:hypothetical protein LEP1GSC016_2771 [Leptospira borgpetersenii serovar Hardjo-bovis str. Sponselee]
MEFELCKSILKCGNYNKSRFYEQILKVGTSTFRNSFSFPTAEFTLFYHSDA